MSVKRKGWIGFLLMLSLVGCADGMPTEEVASSPVVSSNVEQPENTIPVEDNTPEIVPTASPVTDDPDDPENVAQGDRADTLTMVIEGQEEIVEAVRHTSWLGYAMTYDPALFVQTEETGEDCESDIYRLDESVDGRPEVAIYMDRMNTVQSLEDLVEQYEKEIGTDGKTVALGQHGYAAIYLRQADGMGSNDAITEYYFTEQNAAVFRIRVCNFADGEEGYGARMNAMLSTLTF